MAAVAGLVPDLAFEGAALRQGQCVALVLERARLVDHPGVALRVLFCANDAVADVLRERLCDIEDARLGYLGESSVGVRSTLVSHTCYDDPQGRTNSSQALAELGDEVSDAQGVRSAYAPP